VAAGTLRPRRVYFRAMNRRIGCLRCRWIAATLVAAAALTIALLAGAQGEGKGGSTAKPAAPVWDLPPGSPELIRPAELAKDLSSTGAKPIVFNVGPRVIYLQAHIPGAEYMGPAASPEGLEKLRARAASLPRDSFLVIYCGCCPWEHCPNIRPAYKELKRMGFTRLKVLYIANSFGTDWVEKGYPTAKGE
jgi:thiosulfate/3-mercaptopyruvate sulfurtransferase